jgi:glycosyltransferase involved in cell wall biosynthesis
VTHFGTLTIFFPMWNEEEYIGRAIDAAREACEALVVQEEISDYELLIIDDASNDATPEIADEMARSDRHVRVVHHPVNRKLGGSLKTGFAEAKGDLILYTDADLPFDMDEVDRTGEGHVRVVYSFFFNRLVRILFGLRMRDVNFAFKLCRREVFDHVDLESESSFIDAELIVRAKGYGYKVVQFGVDYFPRTRGVSTLSSPAVIVKLLRDMFRLRKELQSISPVVKA